MLFAVEVFIFVTFKGAIQHKVTIFFFFEVSRKFEIILNVSRLSTAYTLLIFLFLCNYIITKVTISFLYDCFI